MNIEDITTPPQKIDFQKWQLGHFIKNDIEENSIVLFFATEYRASHSTAKIDTRVFREKFYALSPSDWAVNVVDIGDLILGKTLEDSYWVIEELISYCLYQKAIPIFVGGSMDLIKPLLFSINHHHRNIEWSHIGSQINLGDEQETFSANNALFKVFTDAQLNIQKFHWLGYQTHLNDRATLKLMENVDFSLVRLAELMDQPSHAEPYMRRADFVSVDCDGIESSEIPFSISPQVNGLNKREICGVMKESGLSQNLKAFGIFNFSYEGDANFQLLAQMIWYLIDGIQIQKSHPKTEQIERFVVLLDDHEYHFKREVFSDLWYFGESELLKNCLPCTYLDYENLKKGYFSKRILSFLSE